MTPQIEINEYLSLVVLMGILLLIAFQLPVVMILLAAMGLVSPRFCSKHRFKIVFGCFVFGVVTTPNQDIISNVAFPLLLWALFEVGLIGMRFVWRDPDAA
jgi:sec-independent protein translocase protein TatC